MNISSKAKELAGLISASGEFRELMQAKRIIDSRKELKQKIESYKSKEMEIRTGRHSSDEYRLKEAELSNAFNSLSSIPEISRFLKAEKSMNNMLQGVYRVIEETLVLELK
jgi:cell fate (sporulation/competence/biofilm development) regulator YlbF (YheA/YmcA/DUF963 family)